MACDEKIAIVGEYFICICRGTAGFEIGDSAAHAIVRHGDKCLSVCVGRCAFPQDGSVLAVVGDGPNTGRCLNQGLIAIVVILRLKLHLRRDGGIAPYHRVLVEAVGSVCAVSAEVKGGNAIADVVINAGIFCVH